MPLGGKGHDITTCQLNCGYSPSRPSIDHRCFSAPCATHVQDDLESLTTRQRYLSIRHPSRRVIVGVTSQRPRNGRDGGVPRPRRQPASTVRVDAFAAHEVSGHVRSAPTCVGRGDPCGSAGRRCSRPGVIGRVDIHPASRCPVSSALPLRALLANNLATGGAAPWRCPQRHTAPRMHE